VYFPRPATDGGIFGKRRRYLRDQLHGLLSPLARVSQPQQVRHCLEYVFDIRVDYAQVERNTHAMWEEDQGKINIQRLAQAHVLPVKE